MKRVCVVMFLVLALLVQVMPVQAQDDDCRVLMDQVNTLIGQAQTALDDGDVATAQSLLAAAQTLAGLCLDESGGATPTTDDGPVEATFNVAGGGTLTLAHPPEWVVFNPQDAGEGIEGLFLFSSAAARDTAMSPDGTIPPGEVAVRVTIVPQDAVEEEYTGVMDLMQTIIEESEGAQAGTITETTFNERPAAYVTMVNPAQEMQNVVVLIEGERVFVLLMGMMAEGDIAQLEQMTLAIAESIVLDAGG